MNHLPSAEEHPIPLEAETGAVRQAGCWLATATPCWLTLAAAAWKPAGRWIRLEYSASFFDDPVRPLIRFDLEDGASFTEPMNGPVFGRGAWIGRIPGGTCRIAISPVARAGRFDFRIDAVTALSRAALVWRGLAFDPAWLPWAFGAKLIGSHREAWQTLRFAATATPLENYHRWKRENMRAWEPDGLDRPRFDWTQGPVVHLAMDAAGAPAEAVAATIASLQAQVYPRWQLSISGGSALPAGIAGLAAGDARIGTDDGPAPASPGDLVGRALAGDVFAPHAMAVLADAAHERPDITAFYGDEEVLLPSGRLGEPRLLPAFSRRFQARSGYLGHGMFVRAGCLAAAGCGKTVHLAQADGERLAEALARQPDGAVLHIRRVLRSCPPRVPASGSAPATVPVAGGRPPAWPKVAIVIPTRDHPKLLAKCIEGLDTLTDYPDFEVVLVDNGTTDTKALALIESLKANPRYTILHRPGPFNYSALCNDGAAASDAPMLLFLNNDIVMLNDQWLKPLVALALEPDVGVVGSKLLFPNGRIQHAGVVLGLGSIAGHIYRGAAADIPGYLDRLTVPHEVSSVTGACIAIERRKFDAIGRFDAENLPVELNDIDLCLRAAEHGLTTLWTPESVLCHLQSASRGFQVKPYKIYDKERRFFIARWANVIRDDPYFHPALSLFSHRPALA